MRISKAEVILLFILSFLSITAFAADQSDCDMPGFLHCSYLSGLPNDLADGRFIKETYQGGSIINCENNTSVSQIIPEDAVGHEGATTVEYSICQDVSGLDCETVGHDAFIVTKNGDAYAIDPKFYKVDFSHVANKFVSCKPGVNARHSYKFH